LPDACRAKQVCDTMGDGTNISVAVLAGTHI
jgi:hypothetical protein